VLVRQRQIEVLMKRRQRGKPGSDGRRTVISAFERDELLLLRPPRRVVVVRDVADGGVHGVGPAQREIDARKRRGRKLNELFCEANGRLAAEMKVAGGVGQAAHLFRGHAHDAFVTVARIDAPEPGEGVEQFVAFDVAQPRAASRFENGDAALFMRAQADDRMDQMLAVGFDECGSRHGVSVQSFGGVA
jgi:hypothetical protein